MQAWDRGFLNPLRCPSLRHPTGGTPQSWISRSQPGRSSAASITNIGGKGSPRERQIAQKTSPLDHVSARMANDCSARATSRYSRPRRTRWHAARYATRNGPRGHARAESIQFLALQRMVCGSRKESAPARRLFRRWVRGCLRGGAKSLSDLVHSCTVERTAFINRLRLMARCPHRLLVVTSTLSQVKSPYAHASGDPNGTPEFLVGVVAGLQVPFVCSETHELGEELVGSYLYQVHLYHWLESNDYGRFLADNDL